MQRLSPFKGCINLHRQTEVLKDCSGYHSQRLCNLQPSEPQGNVYRLQLLSSSAEVAEASLTGMSMHASITTLLIEFYSCLRCCYCLLLSLTGTWQGTATATISMNHASNAHMAVSMTTHVYSRLCQVHHPWLKNHSILN